MAQSTTDAINLNPILTGGEDGSHFAFWKKVTGNSSKTYDDWKGVFSAEEIGTFASSFRNPEQYAYALNLIGADELAVQSVGDRKYLVLTYDGDTSKAKYDELLGLIKWNQKNSALFGEYDEAIIITSGEKAEEAKADLIDEDKVIDGCLVTVTVDNKSESDVYVNGIAPDNGTVELVGKNSKVLKIKITSDEAGETPIDMETIIVEYKGKTVEGNTETNEYSIRINKTDKTASVDVTVNKAE